MNCIKQHKLINRRPLLLAALFLSAGILAAYYFAIPVVVALIAAAVLIFCSVILFILKKPFVLLLYPAVFFMGAFLVIYALGISNVGFKEGEPVTFMARVAELPEKSDYGYTHILDDVTFKDLGHIQGKIRFVSENEYAYGSVLEINTQLKRPKGVINPGGYDERLTLLSKGIILKAYAKNAKLLKRNPLDIYGFLLQTKTSIKNLIHSIFPKDVYGLALGMFLGDTEGLSDETYAAYKTTGAAHILAVSGLNVGIIIFVFFTFLKLLRIPKKPRYFATLVFIAAYACLTGLGASIVRASIMSAFLLTIQLAGEKTDPLIVFSASWIFILIINPIDLFMPGFLLSFGAVFGMITVGSVMYELLSKWPKEIREITSANIGATLGTGPILASRFYSFSWVSLVGNFFIVPISSAATICITLSVVLGAIWAPLAIPLVFVSTGLMRIIETIVYLLQLIPFASIPVGALPTVIVLAVFIWMLLVSQYTLLKPALKKVAALAMAVIVIAAAVFCYISYDGLYIAFLDVGQGDTAFVRTPSGVCFLVDGGDEWAADDIASFLDYKGYALDFVFLSHPHDDHMGGILRLIKQGRIKKVYATQKAANTQPLKAVQVTVLKKGDDLQFGDVHIKVLHPDQETTNENNNSLVLDLQYRNFNFLFPGDISSKVEKTILQDIPKTDIIKAAHHGADTSSCEELLKKADTEYAVISVGNNTYGQPGSEALQRLKNNAKVFRTDKNHAIEFFIKEKIDTKPLYEY